MKSVIVKKTDSLQKILDDNLNESEVLFKLESGIYHEKITINNNNIVIEGEDPDKTIITFSDYNYKLHEDGQIFNTFRTPSLNVLGKNVSLKNLSVRNDSGKGKEIGQAVALSVYGTDFKAINCHFQAYQDTIFCGPLPVDLTIRYQNFLPKSQLHTDSVKCGFVNCLISGAVDFIFGSAEAIFDHCHIVATHPGYIVAPSTYESQKYGFVFRNSIIENQSGTDQVYLARPWRNHGATAFLNCKFIGKFHPDRYHDWEKTVYRFQEYPYVDSNHSTSLDFLEVEQLRNCGVKS